MLRLVFGLFIGALLVAPVGFGSTGRLLAGVGQALFVVLVASVVLLSIAGAVWSRRWSMDDREFVSHRAG